MPAPCSTMFGYDRSRFRRPRSLTALAWLLLGTVVPACSPQSGAGGEPPREPAAGGSPGNRGGSGGGTPSEASGGAGGGAGSSPAGGSGGAATPGGSGGATSPGSGGAGGEAPAGDDAAAPSDDVAAVPDGPSAGGPGTPIADGLAQLLVSRAIGLGYYHACHLLASQEIKCYGSPPTEPRLMPPAIKSNMIFCAHNGCCVLTGGNTATPTQPGQQPGLPAEPGSAQPLMIRAKRLACWGHKNTFFPPANLEMDPIFFAIGYDHGCVLNSDSSVACWGQPGTMNAPPAGLKAKSIAVASFFNCAIKLDDSVVCWGINPPQPPPGLKAKLVAAIFHSSPKLPDAPTGTRHACAIQLDDTVKCWGDNIEGTTDVPADLGKAKDIAVATYNSCALRLDGTPICWGTKRYNLVAERFHPMPSGLKLKGIRSKLATYCGLQMDDTMACWGDESSTHITIPAGTKFYSVD